MELIWGSSSRQLGRHGHRCGATAVAQWSAEAGGGQEQRHPMFPGRSQQKRSNTCIEPTPTHPTKEPGWSHAWVLHGPEGCAVVSLNTCIEVHQSSRLENSNSRGGAAAAAEEAASATRQEHKSHLRYEGWRANILLPTECDSRDSSSISHICTPAKQHQIIVISPPCLAACRRCTTCEQKEEPGPRNSIK